MKSYASKNRTHTEALPRDRDPDPWECAGSLAEDDKASRTSGTGQTKGESPPNRGQKVPDVRNPTREGSVLQHVLRNGHGAVSEVDGPGLIPTYSNTGITTFLRCREEFRIRYALGRVPKRKEHALEFGKIIDKAISRWWWNHELEDAIKVVNEGTYDFAPLSLYDRSHMRALVKGYHARWIDEAHDTKSTQFAFYATKAGYTLHGKLDGIRWDVKDRELKAWELKTTSQDFSVGSIYDLMLRTNNQIGTYFEGLACESKSYSRISTMIYDIIGKTGIKPKRATPPDKLKYYVRGPKKGQLHDSLRLKDQHPDEYEQEVLKNIAKRPDAYYRRRPVVRLEEERNQARKDIDTIARDMLRVLPNEKQPKTDASCKRYNRPCPYLSVCAGVESIEDDRFFEDRKNRE